MNQQEHIALKLMANERIMQIIKAMYRNTDNLLTINQLGKMTTMGRHGVRGYLDWLIFLGVVKREEVGRAKVHTLKKGYLTARLLTIIEEQGY